MSTRGQNTERFNDELVRLNARLANLAKHNLLSEAVQAEYLYRDLMNRLYGWDLRDANEKSANFEAIDLVDPKYKVVVQVSVSCTTTKINDTLSRDSMAVYHYRGYRLKFCFIGEQKKSVKSSRAIRNPHGVKFDQRSDILLTEDLLTAFMNLDTKAQREALHIVDDAGHQGFYEWVCDRFYGDTGGELYGDVPLSECYIEPTLDAQGEDGLFIKARKWVESFVGSRGEIGVLCGEPGHGKTSLCHKAVCDFYKSGWLAGRVSNVFCFSLNPAGTAALDGEQLDFYALLSWGLDRRDPNHRVKPEDCEGALVLLDAFDELLEWYPMFDLTGFMQDHVAAFRKETNAHVIITTRSMVVQPDSNTLWVSSRTRVPIVRLQLVSKKQQIGWIGNYTKYLRSSLKREANPDNRNELKKQLAELEDYTKRYGKLGEDIDFQKVLGIPIIFRMIVAARFLPKQGESITSIYNDLFDITWKRHRHKATVPSTDPREETRARLSRHALRVYADDADTAVVEDIPESSWLFSFYTTHHGQMRVGFLHRSFYQYFLAREIISWFRTYEKSKKRRNDKIAFRNCLSNLMRRRIDKTTLSYICDFYSDDKGKIRLDAAFTKAYEILKRTDGFLALPKDDYVTAQIKSTSPLERAGTVFWNVISICSICNHITSVHRVNSLALRSYSLDDCYLKSAYLENANLAGICLQSTNLEKANLSRAELEGANLQGANLHQACLTYANLKGANLDGANLAGAHLENANLLGASLTGANLQGANLGGASLAGACLENANLAGADLQNAKFLGANLTHADLKVAHLEGADLEGTTLRRADLTDTHLEGASLLRVNLQNARLENSKIDGSNLFSPDILRAHLKDEVIEVPDFLLMDFGGTFHEI